MAKEKSYYVCQNCGYRTPRWSGKCPECGEWGSLVEELQKTSPTPKLPAESQSLPVSLSESKIPKRFRFQTGISEFDRIAGKGIVKGSVSLLTGEPGIGKSTFLLQVCSSFSKIGNVLYVSAEESIEQVVSRAKRLGITSNKIFVVSEGSLEVIEKHITSVNPFFVVFDSIQTMFIPELQSVPGSVSQVRECAFRIVRLCKEKEITAFVVGHVTKEGTIAGPKVLEHIVDVVFQFEGDRGHNLRILRSFKNRFGPTGEVAVFEMTETGLREVPNPSAIFLEGRLTGKPGSVVFAGIEGTRPVLFEIQALVSKAVYGTPQRRARGIDINRLSIILAVLEKVLNLPLRNYDVFVNVVGGVKITEPAVDLPVATAIVSSFLDRPVKSNVAVYGEIGLAGEVRKVKLEELRKKEAERNGFEVVSSVRFVGEIPRKLLDSGGR